MHSPPWGICSARFYLWMLSKMTLHPQTPLSERGKKDRDQSRMLGHVGQIRMKNGQSGIRQTEVMLMRQHCCRYIHQES